MTSMVRRHPASRGAPINGVLGPSDIAFEFRIAGVYRLLRNRQLKVSFPSRSQKLPELVVPNASRNRTASQIFLSGIVKFAEQVVSWVPAPEVTETGKVPETWPADSPAVFAPT